MAIVLLAVVLLAVVFVGGLTTFGKDDIPPKDIVVAEVNGHSISAAELTHFARSHRASVIEDYTRKYDTVFENGFWHRDFEGTTPIETLRAKALADAVRMKIELHLAYEYGLIHHDVSYGALLEEMERENNRRAKALSNDEWIFGVVHFEESVFTDFYRNKIVTVLKEALAENELLMSEEELLAYYDTVKSTLTPDEERIVYIKFSISYRQEGPDAEELKQEARVIAGEVKHYLEKGYDVQSVTQMIDPTPFITVTYDGELTLDDGGASRLFKSENELYMALRHSEKEAHMLPIIDDVATGRYVVSRINERTRGESLEFEDVRDQVRKLYLEKKYDDYIDRLIQSAQLSLRPYYDQHMVGLE